MAAVYRYEFQDVETKEFFHAQGSFDLLTASAIACQQAQQVNRRTATKPGILRFMGCRLVSCDCEVCQQHRGAPLVTPRHDGPTDGRAAAQESPTPTEEADDVPKDAPLVRGAAAAGVIGGIAFLLLIILGLGALIHRVFMH